MLVFSLAACGKDKESQGSKPDDTSKPTVSTPSEDKTTTESKPVDSKPSEDKKEDDKPQTSTPSKPSEDKININSIIGQWKSQIDASEILAEYDITLDKSILIYIKTDFGNDNTYRVSISPSEVKDTFKNSLLDEYDDEFIDNCVSQLDDALYESGVYKFDGDKLMIKWDGDPDFIDVDYNFKGNKNKLVISFPSDERNYNRI